MGISVGSLMLEESVILAPMSGVTDLPFRRLVKRLRDVTLVADKLPRPHEFACAVAEEMPHPENVLAFRRNLCQLALVHLQPEPLVALQAGHCF